MGNKKSGQGVDFKALALEPRKAIEDFVPQFEPDEEDLPTVGIADVCGRNLILWGVRWTGDQPSYGDKSKLVETWLLELSEDNETAPTFLTFTNHANILRGLHQMGTFYNRRIHIVAPDSTHRGYRFVAPTKE